MKREILRATNFFWCIILISIIDETKSSPRPIVNGKIAKLNRFTFAVAFGTKSPNSSLISLFCGGSIVAQSSDSSWAISAAHCFLDLKNQSIYARIGGGSLASDSYGEWVQVEQVVSSKMNPYTFQNDIALVKIPQGSQQTIQRATKMPSADTDCLIFGYGSSSYFSSTLTSNVIRYARTNLISFERCEEILGRVSAPMPGQFCAYGINGSDACFGDSGSGLICRNFKNRFELVGVTSHGMGCGEGTAGVYESVIRHKKWIDSILTRWKN